MDTGDDGEDNSRNTNFSSCKAIEFALLIIHALKANITEEIQAVTADVLGRTSQNMERRVQSCLDANGGHFHHMLRCRHISYTMR